MDAITLTLIAGYALLFGGVGVAGALGTPKAKDRWFSKRQARVQRRVDELEARAFEERLPAAADYRGPPRDVSQLEQEAERLRAEMDRDRRRWHGEPEE